MNESTLSVALYASELDDFEVFESAVFDRICAIGRAEASRMLRELDDELARSASSGLRVKDRRVKRVLTRFGEVEVLRRRYVDPSGAHRYLLDERLRLEPRRRVSASLERSLVRLSTAVSFREAADIVSCLTAAHVSHATAHDAIGRAGTRLAGQAETAAASLHDLGVTPDGTREADPICCEADGTVIALQHARVKRAEVKLAVFYDQKADGAQAVHAAFCPSKRFWREASAVAGEIYDLASPRTTIVSGDGARWVRGGLDVLPHARFILDPFHVGRALVAATGSPQTSRRVFSELYAHGLPQALVSLGRMAEDHPERAEALERASRYLRANADGLWRADPGLGAIEGHIDKVLAARFKKKGQRWSPRGADAMARVLAASRMARPLPLGAWEPPARPDVPRPLTPKEAARTQKGAHPARTARIVSHNTGVGFTRVLRDISGARKADY